MLQYSMFIADEHHIAYATFGYAMLIYKPFSCEQAFCKYKMKIIRTE